MKPLKKESVEKNPTPAADAATVSAVRQQLEFYFGDSNMLKVNYDEMNSLLMWYQCNWILQDRFLKQKVSETETGCIQTPPSTDLCMFALSS